MLVANWRVSTCSGHRGYGSEYSTGVRQKRSPPSGKATAGAAQTPRRSSFCSALPSPGLWQSPVHDIAF